MELDRCVILFDEIDELIRDRSEKDSDPFGRFLTTTMLPKLARLWEQRRVLFFVNTNWITKADPAIRRSQRFDAVLFVGPPSLGVKLRALRDGLAVGAMEQLTPKLVNDALTSPGDDGKRDSIGWLALLGHEHQEELRRRLQRASKRPAGLEELRAELSAMAVRLESVEWHQHGSEQSDETVPGHPFGLFVEMANQETVVFGSICLARLETKTPMYAAVDPGQPPPDKIDFSGKIGSRGPLLRYKRDQEEP
jgi:SpoVK/Ycf46/Vps4 family AAA+-type ATPase